ncbi:MAG: DUF2844 domain-containing protein [Curvibacter sp.]|nr:DUF2844 domain-containing protein [Curvibacter sp.]
MKTSAICMTALLWACQFSAHAALGAAPETTASASLHLNARMATSSAAAYSLHTMTSADGTVVKEYVGTDGLVFAVSWQGPWRPNLQQLLGTSYQALQDASAKVRTQGRRPILISNTDLVLRSGGHPRAFFGVAYLPSLLPDGVTAADIQ